MSDIFLSRDGPIATVTLSNPGKLNALDVRMWRELARVFDALSADLALRCVILCGANGQFAAGADIDEFSSVRATREQGIAYHTVAIGEALAAIGNCLHPTVAAIEGVCIGGGLELACACDLRIASPAARFGIPINRLGFSLAPGEMPGLLQLVGRAHALEILLEGRVFDAAHALRMGLLTRLADDVPAAALESARGIAAGAPLAARANKVLINRLMPAAAALTVAESEAAYSTLATADYREGVAAFLAGRRPDFTGN